MYNLINKKFIILFNRLHQLRFNVCWKLYKCFWYSLRLPLFTIALDFFSLHWTRLHLLLLPWIFCIIEQCFECCLIFAVSPAVCIYVCSHKKNFTILIVLSQRKKHNTMFVFRQSDDDMFNRGYNEVLSLKEHKRIEKNMAT